MERVRDAGRTRRRVIEAAAKEFSVKGYDGTTLSAVARRAKVSKQLLAHHFGSKEALFRTVHDERFRPIKDWAQTLPENPKHLIAERFRKRTDNIDYMRFLVWEAASARNRTIPGERDRQKSVTDYGKSIRAAQRRGDLPNDMDYRFIQLAALSLATFPLTFTQLTRLVTGKDGTDPKFQREWSKFLERIGETLFQVSDNR